MDTIIGVINEAKRCILDFLSVSGLSSQDIRRRVIRYNQDTTPTFSSLPV